jgi:ribosomal protein L37AE/L43A
MGSEKKYKGKGFLSDLFVKAKESGGLDIVRLRDEIRKEIEAEDAILGKFLGLVESFQDIISEEKLRYNAAIKALSKTSGISRQNILEATDNQLEELKILEKDVMSTLPDFRKDLKTLESKSKEIKNEIAQLREKIGQLEKEEQEILDGMAGRERDMKAVEETVEKLFTDIGSEITGIRKKIEEFAAEKAPPQPIEPPVVESHKREEEKGGIEEESKIEWTSEPQETEGVRRCSMCGGQMDFNMQYGMWMCYACGHEEPATDDTEGASELTAAAELAAAAEQKPAPVASEPSAVPLAATPSVKRPLSRKKPCPVCRKQMDWNEEEKTWRCLFCNYERRVF